MIVNDLFFHFMLQILGKQSLPFGKVELLKCQKDFTFYFISVD